MIVTAAYWADTIADGALRLLVLFYFYELGYTPFELATVFLFYEIFGIVTNLFGGWLAARFGLSDPPDGTLHPDLRAAMLASRPAVAGGSLRDGAQALSAIAKDLNKMSAKSAVKLVVPDDAPATLYRWVAILTGSKKP